MLKRLEKTIHDERLINPGTRVLCAVSGGADSVALLLLLNQLSIRIPFTLYVAHLNHCLRPESVADAAFVSTLCASLQVPLSSESVDVKALSAQRREGLEAAGRFARRSFFERVAQEQKCDAIALAHHADDQAETVLFRLARGSGLTGLAAMRSHSGLYIRPLLGFRKLELVEWLIKNRIDWREDASNLDPAFSRNLIRHQVLPLLRQVNEQTERALCRLSRQVALEEDFWKEQVASVLTQYLVVEPEGSTMTIPVSIFLSSHPALRRRVIRAVLDRVRGDLQQIEAAHIDQVDALLISSKPQGEASLPGAWVARRYDLMQFRLEPHEIKPFEIVIQDEGVYPLPGGDHLVVELKSTPMSNLGLFAVEFCSEQISFPLVVRSVRSGDRFKPSGMSGHKQLKNYFIDNKIPHEIRQKIPVVTTGDTILWLAGERRCEGFWPVLGRMKFQMRLEPSVFVDE